MKIALTADPELPVPPRLYGGIERVVHMLADGLVRRGHDVTLFAHPESMCAGRLVAWPGASSRSPGDTLRNAATLARHVIGGRYDLVHSFSRIAYLTPLLALPVPKLMTFQRPVTPRSVQAGHRLSRGTLAFSAISNWMMADVKETGRWFMVPNGVPDVYDFAATVPVDAPLVFLGRIEAIKGPHLAIEIARRAGRRLVIAGNVPAGGEAWFEANVAPHIDDERVRYVGPVDDGQKNLLLRGAAALLMPILWDEPFGIVMAEALACGTPVLGLRRGAVPEVVEDGVSGFVRDDVDELVAAVARVKELERDACRARMETHFSEGAIVQGYLNVYSSLIRSKNIAI